MDPIAFDGTRGATWNSIMRDFGAAKHRREKFVEMQRCSGFISEVARNEVGWKWHRDIEALELASADEGIWNSGQGKSGCHGI